MANPQTLFLVPSNSTVETINNYVINILFERHQPIAEIINAFKSSMKIYKNMTVIITENRYNFLTNFTCSQQVYSKNEPNTWIITYKLYSSFHTFLQTEQNIIETILNDIINFIKILFQLAFYFICTLSTLYSHFLPLIKYLSPCFSFKM